MNAGRVYIREPFATLVVHGFKDLETAHIRLPERFALTWLDVQTEDRVSIGRVRFGGWIQWHDADAFDSDRKRHGVGPASPYHFNKRRSTFGWIVEGAESWKPKPMPPMKSQFRLELYEGRQMTLHDKYEQYLTLADDGQGRDITRNLAPLLTFDQWLAA